MAAPSMRPELGFSNAVFGFGAGLFSLGYLLAEVPSSLMLNKVGARRWMARILITWGIVSGLTAFVWNDWTFYSIRVLLGLSEAGYYPGVILYLTWWFPSYYRSRMMAIFTSASVISLIIGPPVSGLLLLLDGSLGLHGWQWLFVMEALPPIIMAMVLWTLLTDRPDQAKWLRPDQRTWLNERLASERAQREAIRKFTLGGAFSNLKVWLLALVDLGRNMASLGVAIFMPQIVTGLGVSTKMMGWVTAVPYVFALAASISWGWHSDRTGERTWHVAGACLLCAVGLAGCIVVGVGHPILVMVGLTLAVTGSQSALPVFWALPSALLTGTAAAGGIAMINAIGNLGGFLGPWVFGLVKDASGSDNMALLALAVSPIISIIALFVVGHDRRLERIPPRS
jgi:ACS family tartrate transporter-like MFS transporter